MILGVDPSLRCTGIALATRDGEVRASRFQTVPTTTLAAQVDQVRYVVGSVLRATPERLDLIVIERPYVPQGKGGAGSLIERAGLYWFLVDQLMQRGPVVEVGARTRAKYAAGSGNADKAAVLAAVRAAFPEIPVRDHNESDALALAAMGARYLGLPIDGAGSKKQIEAMAAVAWPTKTKEQKR